MKKIYYEKIGRRYIPVSEYDTNLSYSLPKGNHLIISRPGSTSTRYNVDPAYAPMIAAGLVAEDAICEALQNASELKPARPLLTDEQKNAWLKLAEAFGDDSCTLQSASVRDIALAGVRSMMFEAEKLMQNEGVRKSYENFLLMCKLAGEKENL